MISATDRELRRRGKAAQQHWERAIRPPAHAGLMMPRHAMPLHLLRWLRTLPFSFNKARRWPPFFRAAPCYRRRIRVVAGVALTGIALATGTIIKGYLDHPAQFWNERIAARTQSPIYDRDQILIGSVGAAHARLSGDAAREYAFIPLQGELPSTYLQGLLKMENKNYFAGGWHNACGLDIPATVKRWLLTAGAGGSTLSMQLARELRRPEAEPESNFLQKVWRKGIEIGASCRLHQALVAQGGALAPLKLYASYAPTFQGNGTLRGIEAASRIVFDLAPQELSDAQQLILAAAARKPLTLLPPGATAVDCHKLYPRVANARYDADLAKSMPARAVQCQILHRALFRAPDVLAGDRLQSAVAQLQAYQVNGIAPANPFELIPARRLVNLAARTASTMPAGLLANIRQEAEAHAIAPGEPLYMTLDAVAQHDFASAMRVALTTTQQTPRIRRMLCLPLAADKGHPLHMPPCSKPPGDIVSADVLALKVDAVSGGIKAMYASSPLLLDAQQSIGSTAKWVIVAAALAQGHLPDEQRCPRAANDGERALKRVTIPETGYANCDDGLHLMSWERAMAESDNLVFYGIAQELGQARLAAAVAALGLGPSPAGRNLAYELSFGNFGTTPRALVGAAQALVTLAYGLNNSGQAPHALGNPKTHVNPVIADLQRLLPTTLQRDALRRLLEAPVQYRSGTLAYLKGKVSAGKTGTVQSIALAPNGRHFNHAKWNLTYQHAQRSLNLFFIASPLPSVPLAQPDFGFSALAMVHQQILNQE